MKETKVLFILLQYLNDKDEAHPLLRVDVYLGIKELVTVIIFPWPIRDHLFEVSGIADEAWYRRSTLSTSELVVEHIKQFYSFLSQTPTSDIHISMEGGAREERKSNVTRSCHIC